nr:hypothetical protein [Desulfobacula sp.]
MLARLQPQNLCPSENQARENRVLIPEKEIFASDMDASALAVMQQNISAHDFCRTIDLCQKDFFSLSPPRIASGKEGVIVLNPPYGKRLGEKTGPKALYREIEKKLLSDFKGWRLGLILPSKGSPAPSPTQTPMAACFPRRAGDSGRNRGYLTLMVLSAPSALS